MTADELAAAVGAAAAHELESALPARGEMLVEENEQ